MKKEMCTTTTLETGVMSVYDFGNAKLHAYKTNDLIDDEVFIVEKNSKGFVIECPCFFANIKELEGYKTQGIDLVLTSHYTPEDLKDVQTKIDYLENLKSIANTCSDAASFKAEVQKTYPEYAGENYLDMTVGFFFGE